MDRVLNGEIFRQGCARALLWDPRFSLFFLINDLAVGLKCNVKLFADDTSLFIVVEDSNTAANDMNHDLDLIGLYTVSGLTLGECFSILTRKNKLLN